MALRRTKTGIALPGRDSRPGRRLSRVADLIQSEVSNLLLLKINDPRVQHVNITSVSMTRDLKQARIYYSCPEEQARGAAEGLKSAKGYIRNHLARELDLRYAPDLIFKRDLALIHQEQMEQLFKEIKDTDGSEV